MNIDYLKKSDLPLVLYGTAQLGKYVKCFLEFNNINVDFVVVDKEYWQPNTKFCDFDVQPLEDVLANNSKLNIIIAFKGKNNEEKIKELNKMPNVEKCMFFDLDDIFSYLKHCEKTQTEIIDVFRKLIAVSDIYLNDEETAKAIAYNWNGTVKKPKNLRFIENAIPVVLAANENFAPYLAVMLQSLLDYSNPQRIYHFIIFERGFSERTKECLSEQAAKFKHCNIDFIDTAPAFDGIPLVDTSILNLNSLSIDTYSRFFIPYWLNEYEKVIYLDSDMIAKADISQLFDLSLNGHCLSATISQGMNYLLEQKSYRTFISPTFIFLDDWSRYFNAGVLVFDTTKFISKFPYTDFLKFAIYFSNRYKGHCCDQDILVSSINGNFLVCPPEWNYVWSSPRNNGKPFAHAPLNTKIIHFTTPVKPWKTNPIINDNPDTLAYREYAKNVKLFREREKYENT